MAGKEEDAEEMKNRQAATKQYMRQNGILDMSIMFTKWNDFIYMFVPNNWLKMHGYPMHKRRIR